MIIEENTTAQEDAAKITDEDKVAVKKIFAALSKYIIDTKSALQIIVLEHADEDVWGDTRIDISSTAGAAEIN